MSQGHNSQNFFKNRSTKRRPYHGEIFSIIDITCPYEILYPFVNSIENDDRLRINKERVNHHVGITLLTSLTLPARERREVSQTLNLYLILSPIS